MQNVSECQRKQICFRNLDQ